MSFFIPHRECHHLLMLVDAGDNISAQKSFITARLSYKGEWERDSSGQVCLARFTLDKDLCSLTDDVLLLWATV